MNNPMPGDTKNPAGISQPGLGTVTSSPQLTGAPLSENKFPFPQHRRDTELMDSITMITGREH